MDEALSEARLAAVEGEVPVGAIVVAGDGAIVGRGRNRREATHDPTAHAEVEAIRVACRSRGTWRLADCTLYVTLEPCPMCASALVHCRIARVVYGCRDPKAGAIDTMFNIGRTELLNHIFDVTENVQAEESRQVLRDFFQELRASGKNGRRR